MKEFLFILKECGFTNMVFYVFYKIQLKLKLLPFLQQRKKNKNIRLRRIYDALLLLESTVPNSDDRKFIIKKMDPANNGSVQLRPYSSDTNVFNQIIIQEEYKSVVEIYGQMFKAVPNHIFDCGGNIGLTSIYFKKCFPGASITIIEPFEDNVKMIELNFKSAFLKDYQIIKGGIWNIDTKLSINRDFGDGEEWSVSLEESKDKINNIPVFSLSKLIENNGNNIDILKIDIEGAEKVLFENTEYAAEFLNKVKCIAIEIHDELDIRKIIYESLLTNHYFYFNTGELTIGINKSFLK